MFDSRNQPKMQTNLWDSVFYGGHFVKEVGAAVTKQSHETRSYKNINRQGSVVISPVTYILFRKFVLFVLFISLSVVFSYHINLLQHTTV